jgi:hypothetical protein
MRLATRFIALRLATTPDDPPRQQPHGVLPSAGRAHRLLGASVRKHNDVAA